MLSSVRELARDLGELRGFRRGKRQQGVQGVRISDIACLGPGLAVTQGREIGGVRAT